jgi:branched-chain amino acid transport system permease protein
VVQYTLIKPMFVGIIEAKMEYATIVTIALSIFLRNIAVAIGGPYIYTPPDYAGPTKLLTLPLSGNRVIALLGAIVVLGLFYYFIKKSWPGRAFQGVAQNRSGIQTAGVDVLKYDMLAFGIGTALAGAAGACWPPPFWCIRLWRGADGSRFRNRLSSPGWGPFRDPGGRAAIRHRRKPGSAFISPSFVDIYGFVLLVGILLIKPYGLFGKPERAV